MTDSQAITEFLQRELAGCAMPVRDLEARARAEGLLEAGQVISQTMPWRTAGRKLGVVHFREDDRWFLKLPSTSTQDDSKAIAADPQDAQGDSSAETAIPDVVAGPDTTAPHGDIATAPDTVAAGGEVVSPDCPSTPAEDLVAARRQFAEQMANWYESAEALALMREARAAVDRYLVTGDLNDCIRRPSIEVAALGVVCCRRDLSTGGLHENVIRAIRNSTHQAAGGDDA
jgi:hypothetical protein